MPSAVRRTITAQRQPPPLLRGAAHVVFFVILLFAVVARGAEPNGPRALLAKYPSIQGQLNKNQFGLPLYLESQEAPETLHVDVFGVIEHPFEEVKSTLVNPTNWCDITSLHINIKSCTSAKTDGQWLLTLYSGRKYYQPPEKAYKLVLQFRIAAQQPDYLDLILASEKGPLFTKNHRMRIQAVPLDAAHTLMYFSYGYSYGSMARAAIKTYFATIAKDKVGFSVVGSGAKGEPVYLGGVRGSVERNAVRYFLALETYLDTLRFPFEQRFEKSLSRSYDLTAKFPRQLYEMDKNEYLVEKRRERRNQLALQKGGG